MQYRPLGRSNLKVSALCLGTMTWGEQNTQQEAFAQIDRARDAGVNFIDTAEMYPVPPKAETSGATETIIGNFFQQRGEREKWILASKITGPGNGISHLRGGRTRFTREHINQAIEGSLKRLQTDYIDLYQLHWPDRQTNFFGQLGYRPGGAGRPDQGRQGASYRTVERNPLGRQSLPASGGIPRLAAHGLDPEPL